LLISCFFLYKTSLIHSFINWINLHEFCKKYFTIYSQPRITCRLYIFFCLKSYFYFYFYFYFFFFFAWKRNKSLMYAFKDNQQENETSNIIKGKLFIFSFVLVKKKELTLSRCYWIMSSHSKVCVLLFLEIHKRKNPFPKKKRLTSL
jgi:hypothetical protein